MEMLLENFCMWRDTHETLIATLSQQTESMLSVSYSAPHSLDSPPLSGPSKAPPQPPVTAVYPPSIALPSRPRIKIPTKLLYLPPQARTRAGQGLEPLLKHTASCPALSSSFQPSHPYLSVPCSSMSCLNFAPAVPVML